MSGYIPPVVRRWLARAGLLGEDGNPASAPVLPNSAAAPGRTAEVGVSIGSTTPPTGGTFEVTITGYDETIHVLTIPFDATALAVQALAVSAGLIGADGGGGPLPGASVNLDIPAGAGLLPLSALVTADNLTGGTDVVPDAVANLAGQEVPVGTALGSLVACTADGLPTGSPRRMWLRIGMTGTPSTDWTTIWQD